MARRPIDLLAAGALSLLAAIGLVDVLLLLPRSLAPSTPLSEAWMEATAAGDLAPVLVGPVVWGTICALSAARHLRARRPASPVRVGAVALIELGALAVLLQVAAFGMSLWISDHLPPFEGGTTPLESALLLLGAVSIVVGVVVLTVTSARRRAHASRAA